MPRISAATGITSGSLLRGVHYDPDGATTYSMVMRSRSGTVRYIEAHHEFEKLERFSSIAYRRFINDMNWLLMPLEVFDARAHRVLDGQRTDSCGRTWDILKLTWDAGAGLTACDVYWLWINHDTGVVEEWDTKSGAAQPDEAPVQLLFKDYRRVGGLLLSARREVKGKNQVIRFDDLQVLPQAPKNAFD